MEILGA